MVMGNPFRLDYVGGVGSYVQDEKDPRVKQESKEIEDILVKVLEHELTATEARDMLFKKKDK